MLLVTSAAGLPTSPSGATYHPASINMYRSLASAAKSMKRRITASFMPDCATDDTTPSLHQSQAYLPGLIQSVSLNRQGGLRSVISVDSINFPGRSAIITTRQGDRSSASGGTRTAIAGSSSRGDSLTRTPGPSP